MVFAASCVVEYERFSVIFEPFDLLRVKPKVMFYMLYLQRIEVLFKLAVFVLDKIQRQCIYLKFLSFYKSSTVKNIVFYNVDIVKFLFTEFKILIKD